MDNKIVNEKGKPYPTAEKIRKDMNKNVYSSEVKMDMEQRYPMTAVVGMGIKLAPKDKKHDPQTVILIVAFIVMIGIIILAFLVTLNEDSERKYIEHKVEELQDQKEFLSRERFYWMEQFDSLSNAVKKDAVKKNKLKVYITTQ